MAKKRLTELSDEHLQRVRRMCMSLPGTTEKLSHGAPTFFSNKRTYLSFANNVHGDGRLAVWVAAQQEIQDMVVHTWPRKFFRPPYVGGQGWIGINLNAVDDDELEDYVLGGWRMTMGKKRSRF